MIRTKETTAGYMALLVLFLAAVALTLLPLAGPASGAGPAKTTLHLRAQGTDLSGTVQSRRGSCLGDRNIRLYRQKGKEQRPGSDTLVATDTSERQGDHGEWSTGNTGMRGKFYVRPGKVPGCTAAASKTIRAR